MRCTNVLRALDQQAQQRSRTIGFIGLGQMGSRMALNLFMKRFTLQDPTARPQHASFLVCDAIPKAAQSFCIDFEKQYPGAKAELCTSPAQVVSRASTVITMLPSTKEVESVYLGSDGILNSISQLPTTEIPKTVLIDSTTLDVDAAQNVARFVHNSGASMVDAPVSGGVTGAQAGTLSFLVGGENHTFEVVQPLLSLMGQRIIHCGPSGAGLAAKICNNLLLGIEQIAVSEAMLLGQKLGLNPEILASVINSSTGGCWSSSVNNPVQGALPDKAPPCERDFTGGFATALMVKDMGLATNSASKHNVSLELGQVAQELYQSAMKSQPELTRKDFSSVYKYILSKSNV